MKKKRNNRYFILGFLLLGICRGYGQTPLQPNSTNYPDTLILRTDVGNEVTFAFNRISRKEEYFNNDLWKSTLSVMETAIRNTDLDPGLLVTYRKVAKSEGEVAKVEVKPLAEFNDVYLIGKGEMIQKRADRTEFQLLFDQVTVGFSINELTELEEVKNLDIESVWSQIDSKFENQGKRNLYQGTGKIKYGKADIYAINGSNRGLDNLELSAGVGLGFYRDRFVPDLSFKLAIHMPNRLGNPKLQFGLLYTQHYFFQEQAEGDFNLDINGFLSGFAALKSVGNYEIGVAMGALIHREGSFYNGGTYKLSLYTQKNESKISFTPELIFTDDFKEVIPALKFGLSF